jgi:hypothetical protein
LRYRTAIAASAAVAAVAALPTGQTLGREMEEVGARQPWLLQKWSWQKWSWQKWSWQKWRVQRSTGPRHLVERDEGRSQGWTELDS